MINEWMHYLSTALCAPPISGYRKFSCKIHERTAVEFREYIAALDRQNESSVMSTGGCRDLHTSDVTSKWFFFNIIKAFTLSRHQRHPFSFGWEKRNKRAPRKIFQFPTGSGHLGHGFGKQLVYDLIYTCSGRDFIDEYALIHSPAPRNVWKGREGFRNPFNDFLVNMKRKSTKTKQEEIITTAAGR